MRRIIVLLILVIYSLSCIGQVNFPKEPDIRETTDSTFYKLNYTSFYSYFGQRVDSIFISLDTTIFDQVAVISNLTKYGYFIIKHDEQVLVKYEIKENQISGIGILYHPNIFGNVYNIPYCQAMFKNGKLDGITTFYNDSGLIIEILLYRKGKYVKHLYHKSAKTKRALRIGSKKYKDSFAYRIVTL